MSMDVIMLLALVAILILPNVFKRMEPGILGIAFAFIAGFFILVEGKGYSLSGLSGKGTQIVNGIPYSLLFNIISVSLLFAYARIDGTMELFTKRILRLAGGNRRVIPIVCFCLGFCLSIIGTGSIAVGIIMYPIISQIAKEQELDYMLTALSLSHGNLIGGLAPTAPTGMIAVNVAAEYGVDIGWKMWRQYLLIAVIVYIIFYILRGGWKLKSIKYNKQEELPKFNKEQIATLIIVLCFAICVMGFSLNIGLCAAVATLARMCFGKIEFKEALSKVPMSVIVLVGGMSMFVKAMTLAGSMELISNFFSSFATPFAAAAIWMFASGAMSIFSSASGVVLPTMIPMAIAMSVTLGISPIPLITAICYGSHRTSSSPFSTGGAIILGMSNDVVEPKKLYNQLFLWMFITWGISILLSLAGILNILPY